MPLSIKKQKNVKTTTQRTMSFPLIESIAFWAGVVTIFATALAALSGCLSWYFSKKVTSAKEAALLKFQTEAKVAISEADARAAEANEKAEKERLERIRLEENLAWRRLSKEQQKFITLNLAKFPDQPVSLWYGIGDKEAETFAWELANALNDAGWKVFSPASIAKFAGSGVPFGSAEPQRTGVTVVSTGDKTSLGASNVLVNTLQSLGFNSVKSTKNAERQGSAVIINVDVRPIGPQGDAKLRATNK